MSVQVKLPEPWSKFLLTQPESGMGYQRVDVRLEGDRELQDVVVLNAEMIELPEECVGSKICDIQLHRTG
jgi:hypothetical protein